jgi:hypothetical protein
MRRRILKITGWTALAAVLFAVSLAAAFYMHFYRAAPAPAYPKATGPLVAQQQDLDYFGKLMARDRAFTPQTRAEADRRLAQLKASTVVLDHEHLRVALMQIMALADNGHSRRGYDPEVAPRQLTPRSRRAS